MIQCDYVREVYPSITFIHTIMNTYSLSSFLLRKVNLATATVILTSMALTSVV